MLNLYPFFSNDTFNDAQLCLFIKSDTYFVLSCKILRGFTAFLWKGCLWMRCCSVTVGNCPVTNSGTAWQVPQFHFPYYTKHGLFVLLGVLLSVWNLPFFFFFSPNIAINQHSIRALLISTQNSNSK